MTPGQTYKARLELLKKWRRAPDAVEPSEVAVALLETSSDLELTKRARHAPEAVVRAIQAYAAEAKSSRGLFLVEAMRSAPGSDLAEKWASALGALLVLHQYRGLKRDQRIRRAKELVREQPRLLQALQASVLDRPTAWGTEFELLAADGSAESLDAMLSGVLAAQEEGGVALRHLEKTLSSFGASTPEMAGMKASIAERRAKIQSESPALTFAGDLGFEVDRFVMSVFFFSEGFRDPDGARDDSAACQGQIRIDSTVSTWLSVSVTGSDAHDNWVQSSFDSAGEADDGLALGICAPLQLPSWLARAQRRLHTQWDIESVELSGSLRGSKRDQFRQWLFAPSGA